MKEWLIEMKLSRLLLIIPAIVVTACNNGNVSETKQHMNLAHLTTQNDPTYILGGTYDTLSNSPTPTKSCLKISTEQEKLMILNPHASLDFSQQQSLQQVLRALGVDFHTHIDLGVSSYDIAYKYAKSSQTDNYNFDINYIYQYSGIALFKGSSLVDGEDELVPKAQQLLHSSPQEFRVMCGDNFIGQLDAGASVLINLRLHFDSSVDKNYYDENLHKIGGLQNVLDIIKSNPSGVHYSVIASGLQVGGNPERLKQMFLAYGGSINKDGYPELNCGNNVQINSQCADLVNHIISYASSLKEQLQTPTDYYFTNPVLSSWSSIGINPGIVPINPMITQAMQDLTMHYQEDYQNNEFINNYYQMLYTKNVLSNDFARDLRTIITKYKNLMQLYRDPSYHLTDCFNGFVSENCINIHDKFMNDRNKIVGDALLTQLTTYIKDNQYQVQLLTDVGLDRKSFCLLSPISNESQHLFMVNCDGQVSSNAESPILIQKVNFGNALLIHDLNYIYRNKDGSVDKFNYVFNQALSIDSFYDGVYTGDALLTAVSDLKKYQVHENVLFSNYF